MFTKRVMIAALLALAALGVFGSLTFAQAPTAAITSPADAATISGKVDIQGTADGADFASYKVEFKAAADWVLTDGVIHTTAVTEAKLVTWDTSTVPDGSYSLRLLVAEQNGQYVTTQVSVKVDNATAARNAAKPRRGCGSCHTQISPDGRYTLAFEAANAAKADGLTHPTLPNGFKSTFTDCMTCHASKSTGDEGVGAPLSLRAIVHPAHMFSDIFGPEYHGTCFTCHDVDGSGNFGVITTTLSVNAKGVPQLGK